MQLKEHQPESAATGSGKVGTDDTALIETVNRVLSVQRVTACLSISAAQKILHVLELPGQLHKVQMFFWKSQNKWRERHNFAEKGSRRT